MFILECLNSSPFLAGQAPDRKEVCLRTGRVPQDRPLTIGQHSIDGQSPQVSYPRSETHLRMLHMPLQ